jgi:hypothetical protein
MTALMPSLPKVLVDAERLHLERQAGEMRAQKAQGAHEIVRANARAFAGEKEQMLHAHLGQHRRLGENRLVVEHQAFDAIVRAESTVRADVGAGIRKVKRRIELDRSPESRDRVLVAGLRNFL